MNESSMAELAPNSSPLPFDRSRLDAVIAPVARAHGAEVVDFEFKIENGRWILRVFVEKFGSAESNATTQDAAVDLSLCSKVAHDLSLGLDVHDFIPHRYALEVSSPGIERALKTPRDYVRFAGKKAKLKLLTAVKGQKVLVGIIGPFENDAVALTEGQNTHKIPIDTIASARLVFEFGPQPKPGKSGKAPNSTRTKKTK
jgi:ribosome maturation factor RimP